MRKREREREMGSGGFKSLVLGWWGTNSHLYGDTEVLSANYRLKSDREKLEGKGTAAAHWTSRLETER